MRIAGRTIAPDQPPYVIAEIGVNHDGSVERALALVEIARAAGADAVKLQLFEARRLLGRDARLAAYQKASGATDPMVMLAALELPAEAMAGVVARAHEGGLHAIVTIFSPELVDAAERLPFDAYKTASPDIQNRPLIERLLATGKPLLLSTGAATLEEVERAAGWLGEHRHLFLHCVSSYPTPDEEASLGGRLALAQVSPHALGYSDHTTSLDTGALAVAGGACLLEKHVTHDRAARGPDHATAVDAAGLAEYVRLARRAWTMRGPALKTVSACEDDVRTAARQSLTTTRDLPAGHVLTRADLTVKRPGTGLSPACLGEIEGRTLRRPVPADTPLCREHIA